MSTRHMRYRCVLCCAALRSAVVWCGVVWCGVLCCAALCCAVSCRAVLCCAVLCGAVLRCAVLCSAVRCGALRCCAVRCCAVRCGAVLCGAVLCGAVRCGAALCRAVRYFVHFFPAVAASTKKIVCRVFFFCGERKEPVLQYSLIQFVVFASTAKKKLLDLQRAPVNAPVAWGALECEVGKRGPGGSVEEGVWRRSPKAVWSGYQ